MSSEEVQVGWLRWESDLKKVDDKCLAFTEATCRAVASQHGHRAVNIRWEPHNWSGADRTPHDWHITADFETVEGYASTAHIYTSSGDPEWSACRCPLSGTIKAVFQSDLRTKTSWGTGRSRSMPELRSTPKLFSLAPPRSRRTIDVSAAKSWRSSAPVKAPEALDSWRTPRRSTPPQTDKPRDVRALPSWR